MTVTFTGHLGDLVWGSSRQWNARIEFYVGPTLIASSANADFAVMSGAVTEDISRSVRRDVQAKLLFPANPQRRTVAVFSAVSSDSSFNVGGSNVGSTDQVGGSATVTEEVEAPAVTSLTARSVFVPTEVGDLLDPHSLSTMRVYAGFEGEEQLLGVFDLADTNVTVEGGEAVVDVTAHSFERRLDLAGFWLMETFPNDTFVTSAALVIIFQAMPDYKQGPVIYSQATIGELTWGLGDNRLAKVNELLALGGLEGWFDRNNAYTIVRSPTTTDFGIQPPRWDIIDGVNARVATLNSASRKFSDTDSFNGVVVEGTSQTSPQATPVFAARWNTNPASPLYFDPAHPNIGMGPRPKHIRSELVKNQADADTMAAVELAKVLMVTDSVEVEVPANAKLEMGQYARLVCDALGADSVYRINRVVHDLAGAPAQVTLYRFTGV